MLPPICFSPELTANSSSSTLAVPSSLPASHSADPDPAAFNPDNTCLSNASSSVYRRSVSASCPPCGLCASPCEPFQSSRAAPSLVSTAYPPMSAERICAPLSSWGIPRRPRGNSAPGKLTVALTAALSLEEEEAASNADLSQCRPSQCDAASVSLASLPHSRTTLHAQSYKGSNRPSMAENFAQTFRPGMAGEPVLPLEEAFEECKRIQLTASVEFVEYAPRVWQWLRREIYATTSEDYVRSMAQEDGGDPNIGRDFSEAKGGGYFFFSTDRRSGVCGDQGWVEVGGG